MKENEVLTKYMYINKENMKYKSVTLQGRTTDTLTPIILPKGLRKTVPKIEHNLNYHSLELKANLITK